MTNHIKTKHKIQSIGSKMKFNELMDELILSDTEKQLMQMFYVEKKDMNYIADTLGYSKQGIIKMHRRILKRIEDLL